MTDTEAEAATPETPVAEAPPAQTPSHDQDDRLSPEFVEAVVAHVLAGEDQAARDLVSPLHPADVADLFELLPSDLRRPVAAALAEELDGDVLSEMNE